MKKFVRFSVDKNTTYSRPIYDLLVVEVENGKEVGGQRLSGAKYDGTEKHICDFYVDFDELIEYANKYAYEGKN